VAKGARGLALVVAEHQRGFLQHRQTQHDRRTAGHAAELLVRGSIVGVEGGELLEDLITMSCRACARTTALRGCGARISD
jgi:hypothetical protein